MEAAPAESQINVKAFLHKAAAIDIAIVNPLAEDTIFDVTYQPTDCLSGSSELVLPASKEGVYRAVFTPQSAGFRKGIIAFSNPKIGQFWYDLNLEAENPPPTKLPLFRCPVGSTVVRIVLSVFFWCVYVCNLMPFSELFSSFCRLHSRTRSRWKIPPPNRSLCFPSCRCLKVSLSAPRSWLLHQTPAASSTLTTRRLPTMWINTLLWPLLILL